MQFAGSARIAWRRGFQERAESFVTITFAAKALALQSDHYLHEHDADDRGYAGRRVSSGQIERASG